MAGSVRPGGFDVAAFFAAVDQRRIAEGFSWAAVAEDMWSLSEVLNARLDDHPISPSTISGMGARGDATCQHALVMLRWLGEPPETFVVQPRPGTVGVPLPEADIEHRLRWDLRQLHGALNEARIERGATWASTADRLHCTPNQLTGLRTAKYATSMRLAMRLSQVLRRPSADFIYVADW